MIETSDKARRPGRAVPYDRAELMRRRALAGLEQKDLAEKSGVSKAHVSRLELGRCGASANVLHRLAAALDCEVADLMPGAK